VARSALIGALGSLAALALMPSACGALPVPRLSGTPINVGTPYESGPPAVAVDSSGTAYVAWANTKDLAPVTTNIVQYCVLPPGAAACAHSGTLTPADGGQDIDRVQVLVVGATVIVLADVYGTAGESAGEYIPEQEWQSTDGGATFSLLDGGQSVADGIVSADTEPLSAVVVPGTNVLGYGWDSAAGNETYGAVPTFDEFPLSSPPQCSTTKCPTGEAFAALEPNTNPDAIGNPFGQYASQLAATPGVLAIFETDFSNGPLACTPGFGTAYAYGSGDQGAGNSYDLSPGTAGSAWRVPITQADCNVEYPAVGGGPSGFGVLEENTATHGVVYHPFDPVTQGFSATPEVTIAAGEDELDPSVSQDAAGGVYATFLLGGSGGPVALAYSSDGGKAWAGPVTLEPDSDGGADDLTSSVGPTGQGWAAWVDNGSVFAQQFDAADANLGAAAVAPAATSSGGSVTLTITCASTPCTVTITITIGGEASAASAAHKGATTLASGTFTIRGKGAKRLALHLTRAGKRLLAHAHGHLEANVHVSAKSATGLALTTKTVTILAKHKR
jgi:hypothetical protein